MAPEEQGRIRDLAGAGNAETLLVILGSSDLDGALIYAETVTAGDPSFSGPLAGVPLGLDVYHILEPSMKQAIPPDVYDKNIGIWEMALGQERIEELEREFAKLRRARS